MGRYKRRGLSIIIALCLIITSMPQTIFATDYDGHWAKDAIANWREKGIVVGYEDDTFRPSNAITRSELAAILVRMFNFNETPNIKDYIDVEKDKWYAQSVGIISAAEIMNDSEGYFRPEELATREEAAYAIAKAYKIKARTDKKFKDQGDISPWASASVEALLSEGFIAGNPDGTFSPQRTLTRADLVAMLDKITGELINAPGTYREDIAGNLVINTRDVVLKDMTISGNLYLTEGIGDGDVTLENIIVQGETFANGGGLNSIKSKNSKFSEGIKVDAKNPVRIVIEGEAVSIEVLPGTTVALTGSFSDIILHQGVDLILNESTVKRILVQPGFKEEVARVVVTTDEGSIVKEILANGPVEAKGKGKIENVVINTNGVKIEQKPVEVIITGKDIIAEIAGKKETQESILTIKPSTSGGGSSNNNDSESSNLEYYIKGQVTAKERAVAGAQVEVWDSKTNQLIGSVRTDANGDYFILVPWQKTYGLEVSFLGEDKTGYQKKIENIAATSHQTIDIKLEETYVANIKVVDKNDKTIVSFMHLEEVLEDGREEGSWRVFADNYATILLLDEEDQPRNFNIYIRGLDEPIGKVEGIKRGENFKTDYNIKLDYGLEDTIEGKLEYPDGRPAIGKTVRLGEAVSDVDGNHSTGDYGYSTIHLAEAVTDSNGAYIFDTPNKDVTYVIESVFQEGEDAFTSWDLNAILVKDKALVANRSYSVKVSLTNEEGVGIPGEVVLRPASGGTYGRSIPEDGNVHIYHVTLGSGEHTVTVTVGDQVMIKKLTIEEGVYNNTVNFILGEVIIRTLDVELGSLLVRVGNATIVPNLVMISSKDKDQNRMIMASISPEGKVSFIIPPEFKSDKVTLHVSFEDKLGQFEKEIILSGDNTTTFIELGQELERRSLVGEITITTDSSIGFINPSNIDFELKLGQTDKHISVGKERGSGNTLDFSVDRLMTGSYTLVVRYTVGNKEYVVTKNIDIRPGRIWESNTKDVTMTGFEDYLNSNLKLSIKFR